MSQLLSRPEQVIPTSEGSVAAASSASQRMSKTLNVVTEFRISYLSTQSRNRSVVRTRLLELIPVVILNRTAIPRGVVATFSPVINPAAVLLPKRTKDRAPWHLV